MKTLFALAVAVAAPLLTAGETALPTVDQILDKYVAASGGREAMEKITTRVMKGTLDVATYNLSGTFEQVSKAPNQQITTSEIPSYGTVIQCFDGKAGWASDPERGIHDLAGLELARQKRHADLHGPLHVKEKYKRLTVTGKGKAGDRDVYILEGEPAEGSAEKLYFDIQSGLMVRFEMEAEDSPLALTLEDYKDVDGVQVPFTIRQESPGLSVVIKAQDVKQNVPVDDAKFAKPAGK